MLRTDLKTQFPAPFGGSSFDEGAAHQHFEDMCDGPTKAFRLLHLWQNTYPGISLYPPAPTKTEMFKRRARREGFTDKQVEFFLALQ